MQEHVPTETGDLTVSQVAKELHIRRDTVVAFMKSGDLAGYDVTAPGARKKSYRITRAAVDAFKAGRSVQQKPKETVRRRHAVPPKVREFF